MNILKLNVTGMACEGCEKRIINALTQIPEVRKVVANHTTGIVEIELKDTLNKNDLVETIENLGFDVED